MEPKHKSREETQCNKAFRFVFQRPLYSIVLMVIISGAIYAKFRSGEAPTSSPTENAPRIPATNPLLEPNRPDLIGEPRIDDERQ